MSKADQTVGLTSGRLARGRRLAGLTVLQNSTASFSVPLPWLPDTAALVASSPEAGNQCCTTTTTISRRQSHKVQLSQPVNRHNAVDSSFQ